jgi:hypothetical protein
MSSRQSAKNLCRTRCSRKWPDNWMYLQRKYASGWNFGGSLVWCCCCIGYNNPLLYFIFSFYFVFVYFIIILDSKVSIMTIPAKVNKVRAREDGQKRGIPRCTFGFGTTILAMILSYSCLSSPPIFPFSISFR